MAEALCGPSNALQSFKQHSQADRTLQQDRLTGPRHSPAQGFRTQDPRAGSQDAEFAAFEAGPATFEQPLYSGNFPTHLANVPRQHGVAPGWAADFQNLQISQQPLRSQQFRAEAPLVRSNGWQHEFVRQQPSGRSTIAQGKQAYVPSVASQYTNLNYSYPQNLNGSYAPVTSAGIYQQPLSQPQYQQENGGEIMYDEAGFDDAFAQASRHAEDMTREELAPGHSIEESVEQQGSDLLNKDAMRIGQSDLEYMDHTDVDYGFQSLSKTPSPVQYRIGSDAIKYRDQEDQVRDQEREADDLARTAGQLLNSVQHDTSDKFQNSQFLSLMRKIRDGEVRVQGEEFRETNNSQDMIGLEDPTSHGYDLTGATYEANTYGNHTENQIQPQVPLDSHQLHPGGRFYPEQSPPLSRATMSMSGGLPTSTERYSQPNQYQPPSVADAGSA